MCQSFKLKFKTKVLDLLGQVGDDWASWLKVMFKPPPYTSRLITSVSSQDMRLVTHIWDGQQIGSKRLCVDQNFSILNSSFVLGNKSTLVLGRGRVIKAYKWIKMPINKCLKGIGVPRLTHRHNGHLPSRLALGRFSKASSPLVYFLLICQ